MDVEDFPIITPNDYPAFRRLIGKDMADSFEEWTNLQNKEIREFVQAGRNTRRIPINFDEFARFLHARGATANIVQLRNFTIEKGAGNSY